MFAKPAGEVCCERLFSTMKDCISSKKNRLLPKNVKRRITYGEWLKIPEILSGIQNLSWRKNNKFHKNQILTSKYNEYVILVISNNKLKKKTAGRGGSALSEHY